MRGQQWNLKNPTLIELIFLRAKCNCILKKKVNCKLASESINIYNYMLKKSYLCIHLSFISYSFPRFSPFCLLSNYKTFSSVYLHIKFRWGWRGAGAGNTEERIPILKEGECHSKERKHKIMNSSLINPHDKTTIC